jgi:hypothetical protein
MARVAFVLWVACLAAALPSGSAGLLPSLFSSHKRAQVSIPLELMAPHLTPNYADPWNPQSLADADPWKDSPTTVRMPRLDSPPPPQTSPLQSGSALLRPGHSKELRAGATHFALAG